MEIQYNFILKEQRFQIRLSYEQSTQILSQINQEVGIKLMRNEDYIVKSNVPEEIFRNFIRYLETLQEPEINSTNIFEYYILSQEFGIMTDYLAEHSDNDMLNEALVNYLIRIINNNDEISLRLALEETIAEKLDYFIKEKPEKLYQLPINTLYSIFSHEHRVLNDQKKAYEFIIRKIEGLSDNNSGNNGNTNESNNNNNDNNNDNGNTNDNNNNNNDNNNDNDNSNENNTSNNNGNSNENNSNNENKSFCVLLSCLDADKLNIEISKKLLIEKDDHCGFLPKISEGFINSLQYPKKIKDMENCFKGIAKKAFEEGKIDIIRYLLGHPGFDINTVFVFHNYCFL